MKIDSIEDYLALDYGLHKIDDVLIPCLSVLLVKRELVVANDYNPNSVPADKLSLLAQSIVANGFCFPIVTICDHEMGRFVIIDGFHRRLICDPEWLDLSHLPIVVLKHDIADRMTATVQFNKARGVHQVDLDAEIVRSLLQQGLKEDEVADRLGMDVEAVHRYKQITGIAELFRNVEYSSAWEMVPDDVDS